MSLIYRWRVIRLERLFGPFLSTLCRCVEVIGRHLSLSAIQSVSHGYQLVNTDSVSASQYRLSDIAAMLFMGAEYFAPVEVSDRSRT